MSNWHCLKLIGLVCLTLASGAANAQYKWIDADGRIGYGDLVPPGNVKVLKGPKGFKRAGQVTRAIRTDAQSKLPFELRKISARFPVTLYSTTVCPPCDLARQHLKRRGIPYTEKVVSSARDLDAFAGLGFPPGTGLPVITAGNDKRIGYHAVKWDTMFTASGYPKDSKLPSGYKNPQPEALAVAQQAPNIDSQRAEARAPIPARVERFGPGGKPQAEEPTIRF